MKLLLVLFFLVIRNSVYGRIFEHRHRRHSVSRRILYGKDLPIRKAPFMALVYADKSFQQIFPFTTAVIISDRFLLSSVTFFFVQGGKNMTAYLGENDLRSFEGKNKHVVDDVFIHQAFQEENFYSYNIALIKLKKRIVFNDMQRPISLFGDKEVYMHGKVLMEILGYGYSKNRNEERTLGMLKFKNVAVNTTLLESYGPIRIYSSVNICPGDYGAPIIMNNKLVALVIDVHREECDNPRKYSDSFLATGIYQFYNWILDHVGEANLKYADQNSYRN